MQMHGNSYQKYKSQHQSYQYLYKTAKSTNSWIYKKNKQKKKAENK